MTIADKCPACGTSRGEYSPFPCMHPGTSRGEYSPFPCMHPWHESKPDLMFSFPLPGPQYSKTVTETELKQMIARARASGGFDTVAAAAERMIEYAKLRARKPAPLKLDPTTSIRRQLAVMLEDIGLEPSRFLNDPAKDKPMCMPGTSDSNKAIADKAARELAQLIKDDLGLDIDINPTLLRLWLIARWDAVAKLAHQIHGSA